MKHFAHIASLSRVLLFAAALLLGLSRLHAQQADVLIIQGQALEAVQVVPAAAPAAEAKPAKNAAKVKEDVKVKKLGHRILYPTIYPNPLAFNMAWVTITDKTFADVRALANRKKVAVRRIAVAQRPQPNPAAQNAVQQQMRKFLEPMLKSELSFAARAANLNQAERKKLAADGKTWFEEFIVEFVKKQDPNQQQMLLQGMQGIWFGNQRQKTEDPRDAIRTGVAKLVRDTLSKEKEAAYTDECKKRAEFRRQVAIDNMAERIDDKVKLSPDQWQKIRKTLDEHWEKNSEPQLEAFVYDRSMWPGSPNQWILPLLSPAQQAVMKRINFSVQQVFFNGGVFGQMMGGGDPGVVDDMELDVEQSAPAAAAMPEGPAVE